MTKASFLYQVDKLDQHFLDQFNAVYQVFVKKNGEPVDGYKLTTEYKPKENYFIFQLSAKYPDELSK